MKMIRARRHDDGMTVQILDDGSEVPLRDETNWARRQCSPTSSWPR